MHLLLPVMSWGGIVAHVLGFARGALRWNTPVLSLSETGRCSPTPTSSTSRPIPAVRHG